MRVNAKNLTIKIKEFLVLVKIGFYVIKRHGKTGNHEYEEVGMHFPKELHDFLRCLRNRELEIKATRKGNVTYIILIDKHQH